MKQQVHGNVTGVRDTLIEALGQLYDYEVDEDTFLPRELMQVLARFTGVLNREIAVYITRDGEVVDVSIGTDRDVELRDYRLRRNTQRLSCVRCIHTHPNGDGRLSDVDLSALRSFRYDAMVAIGCLKGEPTFVQSAFLVEKQNLLMDEPVRWYKTPDGDWMRQITESDRIVGWEADEKGTHVKERAVLMGIESMESLDELARLADTAGADVVGKFLQKKDKPDTALFIGRGRADELCRQCQALEADLCIFDEELTGIQARNLEEILRVKVVDRTTLILDIFAQRASSAEGKLQVELAQLQYQSSRLIGQGLVLSRLAGGIGTRGPGESKLEMNRRHIRERMTELRRRLDAVEKQRELRRKSREKNEIPVVALVGYTNAGKSTLLNQMTGSDVYVQDQLFATLDAVSRLRTGGGEFGLPAGGQCHGFRAGLQGAALRSGQKIAQPAEDCRNGQAVGGTGGPVVPLAAPAHKALHGDHGTFPGRLRQAGAGGACRAAQLPQNDLSTARVQGVIPDAGGKVRAVQQVFGPGGELPCHLAGCVMAELPALAEQLEVQAAATHGGVAQNGGALTGQLLQLQAGIVAAGVLQLYR